MNAVPNRTAGINGPLWGQRARDWADLMEPQLRAVYGTLFDRLNLRPGMRYLDVGCGAGLALQLAAQRGIAVTGLDASGPLLEIARARIPHGTFELGDMEALPFPDSHFDLVSGFNAFQYAGRPNAALREAGRVAAQDATILIMTWGEPEGMQAASLITALRPVLPPAPAGAPGPFALSDERVLRAFAVEAELNPREIVDVDCEMRFQTAAIALRALRSSGVAARAIAHSGEAAVDDAHRAALAPFRRPDGSYQVSAVFRCLLCGAGR